MRRNVPSAGEFEDPEDLDRARRFRTDARNVFRSSTKRGAAVPARWVPMDAARLAHVCRNVSDAAICVALEHPCAAQALVEPNVATGENPLQPILRRRNQSLLERALQAGARPDGASFHDAGNCVVTRLLFASRDDWTEAELTQGLQTYMSFRTDYVDNAQVTSELLSLGARPQPQTLRWAVQAGEAALLELVLASTSEEVLAASGPALALAKTSRRAGLAHLLRLAGVPEPPAEAEGAPAAPLMQEGGSWATVQVMSQAEYHRAVAALGPPDLGAVRRIVATRGTAKLVPLLPREHLRDWDLLREHGLDLLPWAREFGLEERLGGPDCVELRRVMRTSSEIVREPAPSAVTLDAVADLLRPLRGLAHSEAQLAELLRHGSLADLPSPTGLTLPRLAELCVLSGAAGAAPVWRALDRPLTGPLLLLMLRDRKLGALRALQSLELRASDEEKEEALCVGLGRLSAAPDALGLCERLLDELSPLSGRVVAAVARSGSADLLRRALAKTPRLSPAMVDAIIEHQEALLPREVPHTPLWVAWSAQRVDPNPDMGSALALERAVEFASRWGSAVPILRLCALPSVYALSAPALERVLRAQTHKHFTGAIAAVRLVALRGLVALLQDGQSAPQLVVDRRLAGALRLALRGTAAERQLFAHADAALTTVYEPWYGLLPSRARRMLQEFAFGW